MSNAPSGNIEIKGTLTSPVVSRLVPGIVLIHGSGPGQRNETVGIKLAAFQVESPTLSHLPCSLQWAIDIDIFTQIAEKLARKGYAVLRYDKRSCLAVSKIPGCTYDLCPLQSENGPKNAPCVNLHKLTVTDFVIDAKNAVQFLRNTPSIESNSITLIGHSQGCSVAPYVAENLPAVKNVIQLAGIGVPIDLVMSEQYNYIKKNSEIGSNICDLTNGDPLVKNYFQASYVQSETVISEMNEYFPKLRKGEFKNREELVRIGSLAPVGFWLDWFKWGNFTELFRVINQNKNVRYLTINSPSDLQVWPQFYHALHAAVMPLPNSTVKIIQGLTHMLVPANLTTNRIDQRIFDEILKFL